MVFTKSRVPLKKTYTAYVRGRRRQLHVDQVTHLPEKRSRTEENVLDPPVFDNPSTLDAQHATSYQNTKERRLQEWDRISDELIRTSFSLNHPQTLNCSFCPTIGTDCCKMARCLDCGPFVYFCETCLDHQHRFPHLHQFEIFSGVTFIGCERESPIWRRVDGHEHVCSSLYTKSIIVIDGKGRQHKRTVEFCGCESPAITLLRWNLWPSSPKSPQMAFHIDLLEWLTSLMLECHLSTKGFCEALKYRQSKHYRFYQERQVKVIYKVLTHTVKHYRDFQYKIRYPQNEDNSLDDGTQCPCCFESKTKIFSLDADFQLVRKQSSGTNWQSPKHEGRFFLEQSTIDSGLSSSIEAEEGCSDFQATNNLRAKVKNSKLDETAVFGSVCRHEFPKMFFSLKGGERLAYAINIIKSLLETEKHEGKLYVTYDIACMLDKHLSRTGNEIQDKITLSIPIFHNYGHKTSCQVLYNPRRTPGMGLTDGEAIERLWSYLGRFSKITKEMTPENRTDLLIDGLIHFGAKLKDKIGNILVGKWDRANNMQQKTMSMLQDVQICNPEVTIQQAREWNSLEMKYYQHSGKKASDSDTFTKEEEYVLQLNKKTQKTDSPGTEASDRALNLIEKKLGVKQRWYPTSPLYKKHLASALEKQQLSHLSKMKKLVAERQFLLELMKKCAKGQSVALRLGRQLKRVGTVFRQEVEMYNTLNANTDALPNLIQDTIGSISQQPWFDLDAEKSLTTPLKRQAIELVNQHDRCLEEKDLVQEEMVSVLLWYWEQHSILKKTLESLEDNNPGLSATLVLEGLYIEFRIMFLHQQFSSKIQLPPSFQVLDHFRKMVDLHDSANSQVDVLYEDIQNDEMFHVDENIISEDEESESEND